MSILPCLFVLLSQVPDSAQEPPLPPPNQEEQEPEAGESREDEESVEGVLVPALTEAIERASGAIGSVRRADDLINELEERARKGELDPRIGGEAQGTVLRKLHKSLGGAIGDVEKALEQTTSDVIPGLQAYIGKLDKELEIRELTPQKQQSLLEMRQEADANMKMIEQQTERLGARVGFLRSMKLEVWEMMDTHSKRLELNELSGKYLEALKKLNDAIDSLRQKWEERFEIRP